MMQQSTGMLVRPRRPPAVRRKPVYLNLFWSLAALVLGYIFYKAQSVEDFGLAFLVAFAALLPAYLWSAGKVQGFPICPIFGLTFLWAYSLPFVIEHYEILLYTSAEKWLAACTIAGYLFLVTAVWAGLSGHRLRHPTRARALGGKNPDLVLLAMLAGATVFLASAFGGWFPFGAALFSSVKQFLLSVGAVSVYALGVRLGEGALGKRMRRAFIVLLTAYLFVGISGLFLVGSATIFFLAIAGYVKGGGRAPWGAVAAFASVLSLLHLGKAEMREEYWNVFGDKSIQVWEYPGFLAEWVGKSVTAFAERTTVEENRLPIVRLSVVNMFLKVQAETPAEVPFLNGRTYAIIPELLIPRILYPEKSTTQEGMTLMNIHYGTQTREDAESTAIGWGMPSEAYANFGYAGLVALALVMGGLFGFVARWSFGYPVLSARFLLSITVLLVAIQPEFSTSIFATALFQSSVSILAVAIVAMRTVSVAPPRDAAVLRAAAGGRRDAASRPMPS